MRLASADLFFLALTFVVTHATMAQTKKSSESPTAAEVTKSTKEILLQKELERFSRERGLLESEKIKIESSLIDLERQLAKTSTQMKEQKKYLQDRLRTLYKLGQNPEMQLLITSQPLDTVRNLKILKIIARRDLAMIKEYRGLIGDMRTQRDQHEKRRSELLVFDRALRIKENKMSQALDRLNELRKNPLLEKRGRLTPPVQGEVLQKYGLHVPKEDEYTIFKRGVFFAAKRGLPVSSISEGVVAAAEEVKGYGFTLIVDHGDHFYSVYSGIESVSVAVGDRVKEAQSLGRSGQILHTDQEGIYFEIRHYAQTVDPLKWIQISKNGSNSKEKVL